MSDAYWTVYAEMHYLDYLGTGYWTQKSRRQTKNRAQLLQSYIDTVLFRDQAQAPWKYNARDYAIKLLKEEVRMEKAHG